jgi:hypothetical protein
MKEPVVLDQTYHYLRRNSTLANMWIMLKACIMHPGKRVALVESLNELC